MAFLDDSGVTTLVSCIKNKIDQLLIASGGGLLVTVTEDGGGTYTANKTAGEIKNVLDVGGSVVIKIGYDYEPLTGAEIQSNRYDFYTKSFPRNNPLTCNSLDDYPSLYSDN